MNYTILVFQIVVLCVFTDFSQGQKITIKELRQRHVVAIETALKKGEYVRFLGEKYNAISNLDRFSKQTSKQSLRTKFTIFGRYECTMDSEATYNKDSFEVTKIHNPKDLYIREVSSVELEDGVSRVKSVTFAGNEIKLSGAELLKFIEDGWNFEALGLVSNERPVPGIEMILKDLAKLYPQSSAKIKK